VAGEGESPVDGERDPWETSAGTTRAGAPGRRKDKRQDADGENDGRTEGEGNDGRKERREKNVAPAGTGGRHMRAVIGA